MRRSLLRSGPAVVGCGSNVVDVFFKVRSMPVAGTKVYFADPRKVTEGTVVGGVTLNHLAWARMMGAPTALLALQGDDDYGEMIRGKMAELGVSTEFIKHGDEYATSACHILLDAQGERAIVMAPASTGDIDAEALSAHFARAVQRAQVATTEISQVPLGGVIRLLDIARGAKTLSMLDVDVPPSVAAGDARLGSLEEVLACVRGCDVLKPTLDAAPELLALAATDGKSCDPVEAEIDIEGILTQDLENVAATLLRTFAPRMVAVTDGKRGCGLAVERIDDGCSEGGNAVVTASVGGHSGVNQIDSTGAGDAFFGGLIAGIYRLGGRLPATVSELEELGQASAAAGAACVEVLGALPDMAHSPRRVAELAPHVADWLLPPRPAEAASSSSSSPSPTTAGAGSSTLPSLSSLESDAHSATSLAAEYKSHAGLQAELDRACNVLIEAPKSGARVLVTGIGKSGYVGRRMAATLGSIGIPSHFVHASEWAHGDLGNVCDKDIVVLISHSGNTAELGALVQQLRVVDKGVRTVGIVGNADSVLGKEADIVLMAPISEEETIGIVPSRSIISQEAVVNALAAGIASQLGFTKDDFRQFHPGGSIGKMLK